MKSLAVVILLLLALPTQALAKPCSAEFVREAKEDSEEAMEEIRKLAEGIEPPDRTVFEECLNGIRVSDTFSLGVPSLNDLLQAICDEINAATSEQLRGLQQRLSYEPLPGFEVSAGGGVSSGGDLGIERDYDVRVDTRSASRAREILERISR